MLFRSLLVAVAMFVLRAAAWSSSGSRLGSRKPSCYGLRSALRMSSSPRDAAVSVPPRWERKSQTTAAAAFTVDDLPDETMYIIDGTALLYNAYYSREHRGEYSEEKFTDAMLREVLPLFSPAAASTSTSSTAASTTASDQRQQQQEQQQLTCGTLTAMCMIFMRFIRDVRPRFLAVAYDTGQPSFRADLYPEYKAGRKPVPADLIPLFGLAPRILSLMGARCLQLGKFEADDVMATLSRWSRGRGLNVVHVTVDKDMLQLVDAGVHVMHLKSKTVLGIDEVREKYGVPPTRLTELQALMGDSADNIRGVPGIGPKTASALLSHFNSIGSLYEQVVALGAEEEGVMALRSVEGLGRHKSVYKNLCKCSEQEVLFMKDLLTLRDDVPLADLQLYAASGGTAGDWGAMTGGDGPATTTTTTTTTTSSILGRSQLEVNTDFFRYRGERFPGAAESIKDVSPSLEKPLKLLRQTYNRLDRV